MTRGIQQAIASVVNQNAQTIDKREKYLQIFEKVYAFLDKKFPEEILENMMVSYDDLFQNEGNKQYNDAHEVFDDAITEFAGAKYLIKRSLEGDNDLIDESNEILEEEPDIEMEGDENPIQDEMMRIPNWLSSVKANTEKIKISCEEFEERKELLLKTLADLDIAKGVYHNVLLERMFAEM